MLKTAHGIRLFLGMVVATQEVYNGGGPDSPRYTDEALVPDGKGGFRWVGYRWAYCSMEHGGTATVDATPEVIAAHAAWVKANDEKRFAAARDAEAQVPRVGRRVKVVRGRKLPVGLTGTVIWYGAGRKFTPSRYAPTPMRVGVRFNCCDEEHVEFTDADNVEVVR